MGARLLLRHPPLFVTTSLALAKCARGRILQGVVGAPRCSLQHGSRGGGIPAMNHRQPWLIRGLRAGSATEAVQYPILQGMQEDGSCQNGSQDYLSSETEEEQEAEPEEGDLAQLPEELCESLESEVWSVGLDGLNVTDLPSSICIVGIDPDVSGAIAVLKTVSQDTQAEVLDVPCVKVQIGKTMRRRHDARSIVDLMHKINAPEGSVAYVEQAMPFPKDGKQEPVYLCTVGWYGTGFGYGIWVGILMALGFKVVPIRAQAWKSALGIAGRQYTKDDSRAAAMTLFPDLAPQLKRKKDHGRADALLIAAFGKGMSPPTDASVFAHAKLHRAGFQSATEGRVPPSAESILTQFE